MNRSRALGIVTLSFGLLVIVQAILAGGFEYGVGSVLALVGGLVLVLTGLYGAVYPDSVTEASTLSFIHLFIFGVCLYVVGMVGMVAL